MKLTDDNQREAGASLSDPSKERQSSIELLRIIAMLMIVGHHLTVHGVMRSYSTLDDDVVRLATWVGGIPVNKAFAAFLLPGGGCRCGHFLHDYGVFHD